MSFSTLCKPLLRRLGAVVIALTTVAVAGCSGHGEKAVTPSPLPSFEKSIDARVLWKQSLRGRTEDRWLQLVPTASDDAVFVATGSGSVTALSRDSGEVIWERELGQRITGGLGQGDNVLVLATRDGQVMAIACDSGKTLWSTQLAVAVMAVPQVANQVAVVQSVNAKLFALDLKDGHTVWQQETATPSLTLRTVASPLLLGQTAYAGFANGQAKAFDMATGAVLWSTSIATPQGASDLERLVDITGSPYHDRGALYFSSYQGNVVSLDRETGQTVWSRTASSYHGVAGGFGNLYLCDSDGVLRAYDLQSGVLSWQQEAFKFRRLSGPVVVDGYLAAVDFEGYLHILSQADGRIVGRKRIASKAIGQPVVVDDVAYFATGSGRLVAVKLVKQSARSR